MKKNWLLIANTILQIILIVLFLFIFFSIARADEMSGRPDIRPLKDNSIVRIASGYGEERSLEGHVYFHTGIDFACLYGTPIYATGDGEIEFVGDQNGYGLCVMIKHTWTKNGKAYGAHTVYGHLSEPAVLKTWKVKKGDLIGYSGNSGRSTGPHLHYELRNERGSHIWNGLYQAEKNKEEKQNAKKNN